MKNNVHQLTAQQPEATLGAAAPSVPHSAEGAKRAKPPDALLTMDEIALYLGVSVRTIKKWVSNGAIPHRRLGRKWGRVRFAKHKVDEWSKQKP
jgi:excisionase family DNA binding protein